MSTADSGRVNQSPAYGLFAADDFVLNDGSGAGLLADRRNPVIPQAQWLFRSETIAVPRSGYVELGFDPHLHVFENLKAWNAAAPPGSARDRPALVWVGSPHVIDGARLDAGGEHLLTPEGSLDFALVPRLESNSAFYNASSTAFFHSRELRLRGWQDKQHFVARTIWPEDFRLDPCVPRTLIGATPRAIRDFVRGNYRPGEGQGAQSAFATRLVWRRSPDSTRHRPGRPLIGLLLNGAQGDDDEAHAGHFCLVTGRVGQEGQMHDWLVANYYTLETESEKGIIASMLPMENYLTDVNSGQAWYRPSWMLVASLRDERTAVHLNSALVRVFDQFYRRRLAYQHAAANCAGISISILRTIGWNVPVLGATSWTKAMAALPLVSASTGKLGKGKAAFDYLAEDRTCLLPALAFEQAAADLLQLVSSQATRPLTAFETLLVRDVEEIMLVRIPQLPSSRVWGYYPVASLAEYQWRLPQDPSRQKIIPVAPRIFPAQFKETASPYRKPLRSDYAVTAWVAGFMLLGGWLLRSLSHRRRGKRISE